MNNDHWIIPAIANMGELPDLKDLASVQPMSTKSDGSSFYMDFVSVPEFVWPSVVLFDQDIPAGLKQNVRDGYTIFSVDMPTLEAYVKHYEKSITELGDIVPKEGESVYRVTSSHGSWMCLAGREYLVKCDKSGTVLASKMLRMS